MSKNKKKKTGKQSHMSQKAIIRHQLITSGMMQQPQLALPPKAKEFMQNLPQEVKDNWKPATVLEVAQMAEVDKRIGLLLGAYSHIHGVQNILIGEITNWLDGFGLWLKGVRPAMNDVERAEDNFEKAWRTIVKGNQDGTYDDYRRDIDSLHEKLMRWEGVPKFWKIGDPLKLKKPSERPKEEGTIIMDDGHEEKKVGTVQLEPEIKDSRTAYCVSRLNEDGTADIMKADIKTKGAATAAANRMAKNDPGRMYVAYEQIIQTQEVHTIIPYRGCQVPTNGTEIITFGIKGKEGGRP